MRDLTLRQIEVIRAVMMTGTIAGAAEFLGVSAPGVSRLVRHTEDVLGVRLFERRNGLFVPAPEAARVFEQLHQVHEKIVGLTHALATLQQGGEAELAFASVPSVAQFIAARAVMRIRRRFPDLYIDLNVLKIEEAIDYLLLERGEFVAISYRFDHPSLAFEPLGEGLLVAIVPEGHALAARQAVSVRDLAGERRLSVKARFAQTVVSLVRHGLGVALIDEFSVAGVYMPGLVRIPLREATPVSVYAAVKRGRAPSSFAEYALDRLREELAAAVAARPWSTRD
jgi:DNA-binding transcriptional LysR family regulator